MIVPPNTGAVILVPSSRLGDRRCELRHFAHAFENARAGRRGGPNPATQ
jgi:hypothetical protein